MNAAWFSLAAFVAGIAVGVVALGLSQPPQEIAVPQTSTCDAEAKYGYACLSSAPNPEPTATAMPDYGYGGGEQ